MNPFYCELNKQNSAHANIIEFIQKKFGTQENFEREILNSFSFYFDEIPTELIQFISYFWNDAEYENDEIFFNVMDFISDNIKSYMLDKISIYQVCEEIKESLKDDENIVVHIESLDKEHTIFKTFLNHGNCKLLKLDEYIYSNEELEEEKAKMIENHIIIIENSLSYELKSRQNNQKTFLKNIISVDEIEDELFSKYNVIAFEKNILGFKEDTNKKFKHYLLLKSIRNTFNKSFLFLIKHIINYSELIKELKIKLEHLDNKLTKPRNENMPAQLNYFCDFLIKNKFDYQIIEEDDDKTSPYLPFLLDLIVAPYLITSLDKNDERYLNFFSIVNDKNLYSYLVKYFSQKYSTQENIIRNLLRFLHTVDNSTEKRFAKQKIGSIPFPPINLTLNSYEFIDFRMVVT